MIESKPAKLWWAGSQDAEPFMPPVATAISRHIEKSDPAWTDIYNRAYEAVYTALKASAQPANEPLVTCGECVKYQTPNCAAKHEQALMDFCSHGIRKPGGEQT